MAIRTFQRVANKLDAWTAKRGLTFSKSREVYTDGSKSMGKKVGSAVVFTDITRRGALHEKKPLFTLPIKVTLKEYHKKKKTKYMY